MNSIPDGISIRQASTHDGMTKMNLYCEYEERQIVYTVRYQGQIKVIDHVPADVCTLCGDILLKPETVRHIEKLLKAKAKPAQTAPLYEYA